MTERRPGADGSLPDAPSRPAPERDWVAELTASGLVRDAALADLHGLLLRASGHQVQRMRAQLGGMGAVEIDALVNTSADEAMMAVLRKLDTFEGRARFTTWAYKFAILQAATEVRRAAWHGREVDLDDVDVRDLSASPDEEAIGGDLRHAVLWALATKLTPHQRRVALALLIDLVPVDVLADRLGTNRGALYKTLHDARTRLRAALTASGHLPASGRTPE